MPLSYYIPDTNSDASMHNQTEITEIGRDQLLKYREMKKYSLPARVIQAFLMIIVGIPKLLISVTYTLIAGSMFILVVSIWRTLGRPESWRIHLKKLWVSLARIFLFCIGFVDISFSGSIENDTRFIVANHLCFFDTWLFLPFLPRPLDKKELLDIPLISEMCDVFEGIPVDRSKSCGLTKELIKNAEDPHRPQILMMPEGATTNGKYMLRFHLGAFLTDLPVQPAAIRYHILGVPRFASDISSFHTSFGNFVAFFCIPAITVKIDIFEPISLKTLGEYYPRRLADETSLRIANHLGIKVVSLTTSSIFKNTEPSSTS